MSYKINYVKQIKKEGNMKTIITEERPLVLRMTDGYGIVHNYKCKDECPYCKGKIINIREDHHGCYDGEWTHVHNFDCENGCCIQYSDMRKYNGYND